LVLDLHVSITIYCFPTKLTTDDSKKEGKRRHCFVVGGNSTHRVHCRQHYDEYKKRCEKDNIPEHHHAIPRDIWRQRNEKVGQTTLDGVVEKVASPREFKREKVLECITQFIVCDDQVSTT
jgi:hypothetical protein